VSLIFLLSLVAACSSEEQRKHGKRGILGERDGAASLGLGTSLVSDIGLGSGGGGFYAAGVGHSSGDIFTAPKQIPIPVPQPYPIPVQRNVPVPVPHPVPVPVLRPYPIRVPQPLPVPVDRPVPVTIEKPIPVPIPHPVPYPVPKPVGVSVPQPIPIPVSKPVPIPVPHPVALPNPVPVYVKAPSPDSGSLGSFGGGILMNLGHGGLRYGSEFGGGLWSGISNLFTYRNGASGGLGFGGSFSGAHGY